MADSKGSDRRSFLRRSALVGAGALGAGALAGEARASAALREDASANTTGWSAERRLRELGIRLPPVDPQQVSLIVPAVITGNLLFTSGHGPRGEDGRFVTGKVGADLTEEEGTAAARAAGATLLAAVRSFLDEDLDRIARVVKVLGMVNATPDFTRQPTVINGFSQLMVEVFGEDAGRGARSAVGVGSLPGDWAVEVEAIFELRS